MKHHIKTIIFALLAAVFGAAGFAAHAEESEKFGDWKVFSSGDIMTDEVSCYATTDWHSAIQKADSPFNDRKAILGYNITSGRNPPKLFYVKFNDKMVFDSVDSHRTILVKVRFDKEKPVDWWVRDSDGSDQLTFAAWGFWGNFWASQPRDIPKLNKIIKEQMDEKLDSTAKEFDEKYRKHKKVLVQIPVFNSEDPIWEFSLNGFAEAAERANALCK